MNTTTPTTYSIIPSFILSFVTFTFCLLATLVFFYFTRRRYHLHLEIREITTELLWNPCYVNHRKNLGIKRMITNFILVILLVEIVNNSASFFAGINSLELHYHLPAFTKLSELTLYHLIFISRFCYVPILCLLLKVVWLAYLHCPYRNTILRWTGYILFRVAGMYALQAVYPLQANFGKDRTGEYQFNLYAGVSDAVFLCLHTFFECLDLVMYLSYSRRLYLHLKSRELEAKLFADRRKFLENKFLTLHFKVSTILVAIALSSYLLSIIVYYVRYMIFRYFHPLLSQSFLDSPSKLHLEYFSLASSSTFQIVYRILLNLDYLYIFCVILFKYCRQKRRLNKVNDKIRPLVMKYQNKLYTTRQYSY